MSIVVQKYGGTSVNTLDKRAKVIEKIIAAKGKENDVAVVVSAMGRKGEPYATDTFLGLLDEVGPNPDPRIKDLITSCGEIISVSIMAHALNQKGYKALAMTGFQAGIRTDKNFNNAQVTGVNPERIKKAFAEGYIVIVAGFQGITEDMEITTLGRGGSDTTAIALGGALGADLVEIYTDVPGVAFTDPRLIPEAPYIRSIAFDPMCYLARAGAKVVHSRAVQTAINYNMPFVVRSTFSDEEGTIIGKPGESCGGAYGISLLKNVHIIRANGKNIDNKWKESVVDEMFYINGNQECCFAVNTGKLPEGLEKQACTVSGECDLFTIMWDDRGAITPEKIKTIFDANGIATEGFFQLPSGGGWAVPSNRSEDAVRAVFRSLYK